MYPSRLPSTDCREVLVMSRMILVSALGVSGFLAAFVGQGCSSSSTPNNPASNDGGVSTTPDSGTTTPPADTGTTTPPADTGTTTPPADAGNWAPSNIPAGALAGITGVPVQIGNETGAYGNCLADSSAGTFTCNSATSPTVQGVQVTMSGTGGSAYVWVLSSLTVDSGYNLRVQGSKPGILVVTGNVSIGGDVSTIAGQQAPSDGTVANGESGAACDIDNGALAAGGGGAFCGAGGTGFNGTDAGVLGDAGAPSAGGVPYGTPNLVPLLTGGGGGACNGGGVGGGALQISAMGTFVLLSGGTVSASGGSGGSYGSGGGGGGAGGAILIESPSVSIGGTISANPGSGGDGTSNGADGKVSASAAPGGGTSGGSGAAAATINGGNGLAANVGGGGGGAGFIRINTTGTPNISGGILSPSATTTCYSVGTL
jgi:hypothetical protein